MMHEFRRVIVKAAVLAAMSSRLCAPANGADGISDIEGKVAQVAMSKLGNERVSKGRRFALDFLARKRISSNCSGTPEKDDG
jgi:hypothetical protein